MRTIVRQRISHHRDFLMTRNEFQNIHLYTMRSAIYLASLGVYPTRDLNNVRMYEWEVWLRGRGILPIAMTTVDLALP